jgi:hypothetical protein
MTLQIAAPVADPRYQSSHRVILTEQQLTSTIGLIEPKCAISIARDNAGPARMSAVINKGEL